MLVEVGKGETSKLRAKLLCSKLPCGGAFKPLEKEALNFSCRWVNREKDLNDAALSGNVHSVDDADFCLTLKHRIDRVRGFVGLVDRVEVTSQSLFEALKE